MFQVGTYFNPDFIFLQAVCNLWEEEATWLHLAVDGVIPVLGLAVDPLTQVLLDLLKKIALIKFSQISTLLVVREWSTISSHILSQ